MKQPSTQLKLAYILAPILILAMYLTPTGYVVSTPGNLIETSEIVQPNISSNILIVTEYIRGRAITLPTVSRVDANIFMLLQGALDPTETITSTDIFVQTAAKEQLLAQEQYYAHIVPLAVAFDAADKNYWIRGEGVYVIEDYDQSGLQRGNIIAGANGKSIRNVDELVQREYLDGYLDLIVLGAQGQFVVKNADITDAPLTTLNPQIVSSTPLTIREQRPYVGRSADLSTALQAYQILQEPLAESCQIAATGALRPDGTVDRILQIHSKLHTLEDIDVFLVPQENYETIKVQDWEVRIVPVQTFNEAVTFLESLEC